MLLLAEMSIYLIPQMRLVFNGSWVVTWTE